MRQKLLFLLVALMATATHADNIYRDVTIGDLDYDLTLSTTGDENIAVVRHVHAASFSGKLYIPGYVDYQGNKYRVDRINANAFEGNTRITGVQMSYGLTRIGNEAFMNCSAITQIWLPSSLTWIGQSAFQHCTKLNHVNFAGNKPPKIYSATFDDNESTMDCRACSNKAVNALKAYQVWADSFNNRIVRAPAAAYDFKHRGASYVIRDRSEYTLWSGVGCVLTGGTPDANGVVTLEQNLDGDDYINAPEHFLLLAVADSAFYQNNDIITLADNRTMAVKIGEGAFAKCPNLTSADIAVDSIMMNAFRGCTNLTTVTMRRTNETGPNGVSYIDKYAFGETGITSVKIPLDCSVIKEAPFYSCTSLTYITVESGNEYFASHTGCLYTRDYTHLIQVPGAWNWPDTENGFAPSMTHINPSAAEGNASIYSLNIPYGVKSIGARAFALCSNLIAVRLPSSITSLGTYAFSGNYALQSMFVNLATPPSPSNSLMASSLANNVKLYVPYEGYSAYKSDTHWKNYDLQTGDLDHTQVWDYKDDNDCYWTVIDNTAHNNYAGYSRDGNARLVRGILTMTIPNSVTIKYKNYDPVEIGRSAFEGLVAPISMSVASGSFIKRIKERAFYGASLNNFTFTRVEEIGDSAFMNTTNLSASLSLDYIKKIGLRAFCNSKINSLTTGTALNQIEMAAFMNATSLATVNMNASTPLTVISQSVFRGCTALKSCSLPPNIYLFNDYCFYNCDLSTSFNFPRELKTIRQYALCNTKITDIELPYGITTIEEEALTCRAARIVFPATLTSISGKFDQRARSDLLELVVNSKTPPTINSLNSRFDDLSLPRMAGVLYVPVEYVGTYKSKWTQYGGDHQIKEGGYDFTDTSDGLKYTITTPVSGNSTGTCEMVYNPLVINTPTMVIAGDGKHDLYGRTYNCTAIGEKCFAGSTSIITIHITPTLKTIGNYAFLNSSLSTSLESLSGGSSSGYIPVTVTRIGDFAFSGCKNLHELFLPHIDRKHSISLGQGFFDDNASDFKCWVDYRRLDDFVVNNTNMWDASRVYPHLKLDSEWQSFSCVKDIDFNNTLVESYVASSYDKPSNTVTLSTVLRLPAGTGAVVHGLADGTYYRLGYPSSTPAVASSMESVTSGSKTVTSNNSLSYFKLNPNAPVFNKITNSTTFYRGYAYLKLSTSTVGSSTTLVSSNLAGPGDDKVPGDVNGDGVCNAADVTALYNWILNNDPSALVNGDQNGDDVINAGDVTTVYNIILGN